MGIHNAAYLSFIATCDNRVKPEEEFNEDEIQNYSILETDVGWAFPNEGNEHQYRHRPKKSTHDCGLVKRLLDELNRMKSS